ncbi:hypothetical protein FUAX_42100 (plasmid) [Fulvitalea axinellae]|uniref:FecR family protein n=2 Tax=Fulvitalea axinellae TaxID=1182444 RepID=A0AAU9CUQ3_9BACT|nr:hypothetical protein FUAX_42100 [Fulvitalea axinellae]
MGINEQDLFELLERSNKKGSQLFNKEKGWASLQQRVRHNNQHLVNNHSWNKKPWRIVAIFALVIGLSLYFGSVEKPVKVVTKQFALPIEDHHVSGPSNLVLNNGELVQLSEISSHKLFEYDKKRKELTVKRGKGAGAFSKLSVALGENLRVKFPDSSVVTLNAGSVLVFPDHFSSKQRSVRLNGEALFDIEKNPSKPFIIKTRRQNVRVLGTVFNVRDYPDEPTTQTSLLSGKVEVRSVSGKPLATLNPGTALTITNGAHSIDRYDSEISLAWLKRRIIFKGHSFSSKIDEIERLYGIRIDCKNTSIKRLRLSGIFRSNNSEDLWESIRFLKPCKISVKEGKVIIR